MGNHRFRLSDMMPNAWFYKLKDMSRARRPLSTPHTTNRPSSSPTTPKPFTPNRASYYYSPRTKPEQLCHSPSHSKASDTHFPISPPRKSRNRHSKPRKPKLIASSVSTNCSCKLASPDIVFDTISDLQLPPIITKPLAREAELPAELPKVSPRRLRVRVSVSTPRLTSKKLYPSTSRRSFSSAATATKQRKRLYQSLAVVKRSSDPQRDFRESMVEMIVENNIRASKDLEDLLACYLTLNSNEYHDVIVKVFEQIWFDLTEFITL